MRHDLEDIVDCIISSLDANGDGVITLDEFLALNLEYPLLALTLSE